MVCRDRTREVRLATGSPKNCGHLQRKPGAGFPRSPNEARRGASIWVAEGLQGAVRRVGVAWLELEAGKTRRFRHFVRAGPRLSRSQSGTYFLSASGSPQQESGSEQEQAPSSLSAQDLSTWISSPQSAQTYTSPVFISLHDAIALTSFPVPHPCAGRGGRRLVDTPGVGGSSGDSRREQPSGDAVVPVTSSTSQTQRLPSKRMDSGCKMVADGLSEGLGEGAQDTISLQINGGPHRSRTGHLRRANPDCCAPPDRTDPHRTADLQGFL